MEFSLKLIQIETKLKNNYYVLVDNELSTILYINYEDDIVKLNNNKVYTIEDLKDKVVKFIGVYNNQSYSITHGNFEAISNFLNSEVSYDNSIPEDKRIYTSYLDGLLKDCKITLSGTFETILTKTIENESVIIRNIDIIDKFKLYDKQSRIGIVKSFNKKHIFEIECGNIIVNCKREDFKKLHKENTITMIRCVCEKCGK